MIDKHNIPVELLPPDYRSAVTTGVLFGTVTGAFRLGSPFGFAATAPGARPDMRYTPTIQVRFMTSL